MKKEMGSFFAFLFTELQLPQGPRALPTHAHKSVGLGYEPLSYTGTTILIFVMLEKRLAE